MHKQQQLSAPKTSNKQKTGLTNIDDIGRQEVAASEADDADERVSVWGHGGPRPQWGVWRVRHHGHSSCHWLHDGQISQVGGQDWDEDGRFLIHWYDNDKFSKVGEVGGLRQWTEVPPNKSRYWRGIQTFDEVSKCQRETMKVVLVCTVWWRGHDDSHLSETPTLEADCSPHSNHNHRWRWSCNSHLWRRNKEKKRKVRVRREFKKRKTLNIL